MKPTGPIPPHFFANDAGELLIGGLAPEELIAEAGGTPVFVYDNNIVGGQIAALRAAMPDGLALYYSVSANPYEPLLNFIGRYVDGFRVVSRGELEHLKRAGLAGIGMTFAGPGKTDDELQAGIAAGATISVESEGEAARATGAGFMFSRRRSASTTARSSKRTRRSSPVLARFAARSTSRFPS